MRRRGTSPRRRAAALILSLMTMLGASACGDAPGDREPTLPVPAVDPAERFPGGQATVDRDDAKAFSQSPPTLDFRAEANFKSGNLLFRGTPAGLGPLFNTQSCQGCHNQDGRGSAPASPEEPMIAMLLHLGIEDPTAPDGARPDPIYGDQLQTFGVDRSVSPQGLARHDGALPRDDAPFGDGAIGEGYAFIEVEEVHGTYPDGTPYVLHRPTYKIRDLSYGPFADGIAWSPRVAPGMIGLGLLEAVPEADILALADPDDADGDGISGRPNFAIEILTGARRLGRFGVKATQPSILQQAAAAYRGDVGVTSRLFPTGPCTDLQAACLERAARTDDGAPELGDVQLALVEFYSRHLAVPRRRGWDAANATWEPTILRGREVFHESGCAGCHVPSLRTGVAEGSLLGDVDLFELTQPAASLPALSDQLIWPYTDLLLHDMGEALADGRPDFLANGRQWKTPPLWGIGLFKDVNGHIKLLHDGRANGVLEAVLWHGGEAEASKQQVLGFSEADRRALVKFVESL